MTDEEINIKIAKAVGYLPCPKCDDCGYWLPPGATSYRVAVVIPNYCNDLNAMHEAEKTLIPPGKGKSRYTRILEESLDVPTDNHQFYVVHATARQRALAFITTLNL